MGTGVLRSVLIGPIVPMILAAQAPSLPEEPSPGWVMAALMGAWMLLHLLEKAGKLPWSANPVQLTVVEADKLREILADPSKVDRIHDIVSREDAERPGFYMVWSSARERRDFEKLMNAQINTLGAIQKSLAMLHNKVDAISDRRPA